MFRMEMAESALKALKNRESGVDEITTEMLSEGMNECWNDC